MAVSARRQQVIIAVVVVAGIAAGVALWAFAPWTLFTTKQVDEALPSATAPTAPSATAATAPLASPTGTATPGGTVSPSPVPQVGNVKMASGEFRTYAHQTSGTATLLRLADGSTIVRLTDFATSNGPDVRVWLSDSPAESAGNASDGKYLDLGELKGNRGNQNYVVPSGASSVKWESAVIWCRRFSVAFGAAPLTPAPPSPR